MKALIYIFTFFISTTCFAEQLHDFNQIKTAVREGKLLRILVDYTKCSSEKELILPNTEAVYTPNAIAINRDGNIGAYVLYFTMKDPRYPAKPVYQHVRYTISSDNSIKLNFTVLNAADYSLLESESSLICKINEAAKVFVNNDQSPQDNKLQDIG